MGEDNAALLGPFFVNGIQQAAMSRADIAEPDRRDLSPASVINQGYVISTRFQRPTEAGFRKPSNSSHRLRFYRRLSLTLATQYLKQMERNAARRFAKYHGGGMEFRRRRLELSDVKKFHIPRQISERASGTVL